MAGKVIVLIILVVLVVYLVMGFYSMQKWSSVTTPSLIADNASVGIGWEDQENALHIGYFQVSCDHICFGYFQFGLQNITNSSQEVCACLGMIEMFNVEE